MHAIVEGVKAPDPLLGNQLDGRYAISARIARGGMATVYRATDERLQREVALKVIHPHLAEQPDFVERFISEARSAASLTNPHIVSVHDQGVANTPTGDSPYLVMELMAGPDLRSELNTHGSFPLGVSLELVRQLLTGLAAAHEAGIIHRDIKPENVLLTAPLDPTALEPKFQAKLTDFGLARAASDATTTQTNTMLGTVGYVAPEFVSEGSTGQTSDIYSVGIMLYELITGALPFQADSSLSVAYKHVNETMPRLTDLADWIPPALDSLIGLLTAKNPSKRPKNASAALDALIDIVESLPDEVLIRRIPVFPVVGDEPATDAQPAIVKPGQTAAIPVAPTRELASSRAQASRSRGSRRNTEVADHPPPRRRVWPILLALLLALIGAGAYGTWWYFSEGPGLRVEVPVVTGLPADDAEAALNNLAFTVERTQEYSDEIGEGLVIGTDPDAGARVHPSEPITLLVSMGVEHVEVIDVVGESSEDATQALSEARLGATVEETYSETVPAGIVIAQQPEAGASVPHSTEVALTVSLGREPISVPDLTGVDEATAIERLGEYELEATTTEAHSETTPEGHVMDQSPQAGETLYRGDTVTLTISLGPEPIEVPDVFGLQEGEATEILEEAGFVVSYDRFLGGYFGTVRAQSPEAGQLLKPGSTVTITIV
ncbi:serine/threonine-protein kinase [Trueperella bonasi]|uniref:non-specific serine/threonine protein kinase n=1 Tax=Trueperella bonasi TaxID=312286 RepID=A0ABT9NIA2_9ACTO|nr:serine/threonine-protein kinase [Trueperella bonasi]